MNQYYVDIHGKTAGPFTLGDMEKLFNAGTIEGTFLYATADSTDWMPVDLLKPLFGTKEIPTPPIPQTQPTIVINNTNTNANTMGVPLYRVSSKSRLVYAILAFFLGILGIHNFYAGRNDRGLFQMMLFIFLAWTIVIPILVFIWNLAEILCVSTDGNGNPMT